MAAFSAMLALTASSSAGTLDSWAKLRRPLHIPHLAAGARCPVTHARSISPDFGPAQGPGPIYNIGGLVEFIYPVKPGQVWYPSAWGGQKVLWVGSRAYKGPVLIRGRQLDGAHEVRFGGAHVPALELHLTRSGASTPTWERSPVALVHERLPRARLLCLAGGRDDVQHGDRLQGRPGFVDEVQCHIKPLAVTFMC